MRWRMFSTSRTKNAVLCCRVVIRWCGIAGAGLAFACARRDSKKKKVAWQIVHGGGMEAAGGGFSHTRTGIRRSETERPCQSEGGGPWKALLVDLLWRRKVVSQKWLAARSEMKSAANVSQHLRRPDGKSAIKKVPEELKHFLEEADATTT